MSAEQLRNAYQKNLKDAQKYKTNGEIVDNFIDFCHADYLKGDK